MSYADAALSLNFVLAAFAAAGLQSKVVADPDYKYLHQHVHVDSFYNLALIPPPSLPKLRADFEKTTYYKMMTKSERDRVSMDPAMIALMNYYVKEQALATKYAEQFEKGIKEYKQDGGGLFYGIMANDGGFNWGNLGLDILIFGGIIIGAFIALGLLVWAYDEFSYWISHRPPPKSKAAGGGFAPTGDKMCIQLIKVQQITGLTKDNIATIRTIIKTSKTPFWDCMYCLLKLIRQRRVRSDCENIDAIIEWVTELGDASNSLVKKLRAYRAKLPQCTSN